jgi:hypothetical protein
MSENERMVLKAVCSGLEILSPDDGTRYLPTLYHDDGSLIVVVFNNNDDFVCTIRLTAEEGWRSREGDQGATP